MVSLVIIWTDATGSGIGKEEEEPAGDDPAYGAAYVGLIAVAMFSSKNAPMC